MKKVKVITPTACPSCDSILNRIKDQIFCSNDNCDAVALKKVANFTKVMKIKGLGEKTLEKLGIQDITEIYQLNNVDMSLIVGEKVSIKLLVEIDNSKKTTLSMYLPAFSIPLIGKTAADKLSKVISSIEEITPTICKSAGLGIKSTASLCAWMEKEYFVKYSKLPITIGIEESKEDSILVCISGKLSSYKTKAMAEIVLKEHNIQIASSMSKKVNYLISEDNKESSKVKKAREYNIAIVTMGQLLKEIQ